MFIVCVECGSRFESVGSRGRSPRFCGATCRKRAQRRREVGVKRFHELASGRWACADVKRPVMVDGSPASSTNADTWASFDVVKMSGRAFGVMLGNGLGCVDLDHCFTNGVLESWAVDAIRAVEKPLFIERSMSGEGLHVFCELPEARGTSVKHDNGAVETFSRARFIRTTFDYFVL